MVSVGDRRAVGTFSTHDAAQRALGELSDNKFDMNRVSLIGRNVEGDNNVIGSNDHPTGTLPRTGEMIDAGEVVRGASTGRNVERDNNVIGSNDHPTGTLPRTVQETEARQVVRATSTVGGVPLSENDANLAAHQDEAEEGAKKGALTGGAVGGVTGLLVGLGILAIPGIGPVMLAGAAATALATTISGTAIGAAAGGLLGALVGLGIPEDEAKIYNERVSQGKYLVIVEGSDAEINRAELILKRCGIEEWNVYD